LDLSQTCRFSPLFSPSLTGQRRQDHRGEQEEALVCARRHRVR
jgi:hypothetical protein